MVVMTVTAGALAAEPQAPAFPYAVLPLGRLAEPTRCTVFEAAPPPPRPLRLWLTSNDPPALGAKATSIEAAGITAATDSVASFPLEPEVDVSLVLDPRSRLLAIRRTFDDDGASACSLLPPRSFRRAFEEPSDAAALVSVASRVRTSLD